MPQEPQRLQWRRCWSLCTSCACSSNWHAQARPRLAVGKAALFLALARTPTMTLQQSRLFPPLQKIGLPFSRNIQEARGVIAVSLMEPGTRQYAFKICSRTYLIAFQPCAIEFLRDPVA